MDLTTVLGTLFGFTCIVMAILAGGGAGAFFNVPSIMIVIGGTVSATMIHFSASQVASILSVVKKTLLYPLPSTQGLAKQLVNFATVNRRGGALALEKEIEQVDDPFLAKGLQLIVDGQEEESLRNLLELELVNLQERHGTGKKILEFMGSSAPSWGMIGTLIGLVQMLRQLEDPSQIGVGMATALITTFYGALLANLVFIPLAGKLGTRSRLEVGVREMIIEGLAAVSRGDNPMMVQDKLQAFIAPKQRQELKATG